jgi:hypothetical protein
MNGVGIGLATGHAAALGGQDGGGAEILGARGGGVGGEGMGEKFLAALEVLRH